MLHLKIPCVSTKTRHGQIYIYICLFFFKEKGPGIFLSQRDSSLVYHWPIWAGVGSPPLAESSAPVRSPAMVGRRWSPSELTQHWNTKDRSPESFQQAVPGEASGAPVKFNPHIWSPCNSSKTYSCPLASLWQPHVSCWLRNRAFKRWFCNLWNNTIIMKHRWCARYSGNSSSLNSHNDPIK